MGLCKCQKRKVTNLFCFEHDVNVCEDCLVADHERVNQRILFPLFYRILYFLFTNSAQFYKVYCSIVCAMASRQRLQSNLYFV